MNHELKIEQPYFEAIISGVKTFEIRHNDRGFQKGDKVILEEVNKSGFYTRRIVEAEISYVTNFQQKDNWVVFGLINVSNIGEE